MNITKFHLPSSIQQKQNHYLQMKNCLSQLFDTFDSMLLFQITQDTVEVNLDNITFGPSQYTITFINKDDLHFKIVYYSILYFIFQKRFDEQSNQTYQKLLTYIFQNQIDISSLEVKLSQQQIKIYLVKFLRILETAKTRRKIVFEELNSIPQIGIIFILLIKQIVRQQKLVFQKNARKIQKAIAQQLQISFDLLSCEMFLFGEQFKVEIKQFSTNCQFMIIHDNPQQIKRIKEQFYLGESAYFIQQGKKQQSGSFETALSMRKISTKIIKKSTMKSIQWSQDQSQRQHDGLNELKLECMKEQQEIQFTPQIQQTHQDLKETPQINNYSEFKIPNLTQIVQAQKHRFNSTVRYTKNPQLPGIFAQSTNNFNALRHKNHKQSFDSTLLSSFLFHSKGLPISKSTKQIKNDSFHEIKQKKNIRQRRVPSFIVNRMKEKQLKKNVLGQRTDVDKANFPKITFSYRFK